MDYHVKQALAALEVLAGEAHTDKNLTQRRVRLSKMAHAYNRIVREIKTAHPLAAGQVKPVPSVIHRKLIDTKDWVDVSQNVHWSDMTMHRIQYALASLESKSVLRRWRKTWSASAQESVYTLACAPRWAYIIARYAPSRLKEAFAWKMTKRKALCFQLEAQFNKKVTP